MLAMNPNSHVSVVATSIIHLNVFIHDMKTLFTVYMASFSSRKTGIASKSGLISFKLVNNQLYSCIITHSIKWSLQYKNYLNSSKTMRNHAKY